MQHRRIISRLLLMCYTANWKVSIVVVTLSFEIKRSEIKKRSIFLCCIWQCCCSATVNADVYGVPWCNVGCFAKDRTGSDRPSLDFSKFHKEHKTSTEWSSYTDIRTFQSVFKLAAALSHTTCC